MIELTDLPDGWILTKLPELICHDGILADGDWVESKDQDPNGQVRLIQLADIGDAKYINKSVRFLTHTKASKLSCTFIKKGDILIARMPDPLGRACIFPGDEKNSVTVVDVCIFRSGENGVNHHLLMHFINSPSNREIIKQLASGTTRKRISKKNLSEIAFPLPPLNEQRRIVSTIEQLTARSNKARAALADVPKLIAQFRQSVLAAAFQGDLTADWREKNPDIEPASEFLQRIGIESQSPLDFIEIHSLPQKWKWASVGSISRISGGLTKNSKREEFPLEYPYLRVANVYANKLDLQEIKTIRINQQELARVLLEKGDILVVEGNGSIDQVGRVAMWDGSISPCLHQNHLIKIRFNLPEMAEFALLWLLSEQGRRYIMSVASSSSGLHTLSLSKVSALPIPVAPENEQKEIVKRITALFDALTVIENRFTSSEEELGARQLCQNE